MSELENMQNADNRLDSALRSYFRAEMPSPWPALRLPQEAPPRRTILQSLTRNAGRLAIAASIAALVIGYLALTAAFPPEKADSRLHGPTIGLKGDGKNTPRHQHMP